VTAPIQIRCLETIGDREIRELSDLLIDCVQGGASVGFMLPIGRATAHEFWQSVAISAVRGERLLLVAQDAAGIIVGAVQIIMKQPENQPHRADPAKMLVSRRMRKQGIGAALLRAAENSAHTAGKTLLVLDTANPDAARLYEMLGWRRCGVIPGYALLPQGGLCDTTVFYRDMMGPSGGGIQH
jgi:GNAT superfamily N-acetyltransferase